MFNDYHSISEFSLQLLALIIHFHILEKVV